MPIRLVELRQGVPARVVEVDARDEVGRRILEMGLTPGVTIKLVAIAPLGDPLAFEVRGYRLSLRKAEAARVTVEPIA